MVDEKRGRRGPIADLRGMIAPACHLETVQGRNLRQDRVIDQKELEAIARNVQNEFRVLKWSAQLREIEKIVNERVAPKKLDMRTIRQYLPAKKWKK